MSSPWSVPSLRRAGVVAGLTLAPLVAALRFAHVYRVRAGFPHRRPPRFDPTDLGLPFEETVVRSDGGDLPAWFIPARGGAPGPGVVLVHGWDSARDRTLPTARFLNAAGFHCLTFDVRGNGANPPETLPLSAGEFGADAAAAFEVLLARPEVTRGAILGHSMGGTGAILAAAADPRVAAVVSVSAPADPRRMVHQTFRLARLPIPGPVAAPLAWLTSRVFVRPRGHALGAISARHAVARYRGPILVAHGRDDSVMPVEHAHRIARSAIAARRGAGTPARVELLVVETGRPQLVVRGRDVPPDGRGVPRPRARWPAQPGGRGRCRRSGRCASPAGARDDARRGPGRVADPGDGRPVAGRRPVTAWDAVRTKRADPPVRRPPARGR